MRLEDLVRRLEDLIAMGETTQSHFTRGTTGYEWVRDDEYSEFKAASLSFLDQTFGEKTAYSTQFRHEVTGTELSRIKHGVGILKAARGELAGGWMITVRGLVSAEVFADFLEMSEHLLDEGYKDAAAVIAGGTLEEHLRQLANVNEIPVEELKGSKMAPRKADVINADLAKSVYGKLDQKTVTAWLDLRNKAAHGEYAKYNEDQVRGMLSGVREFIGRVRP